MEKKMENEMETLGPFKGVYRDITAIMENQMEIELDAARACSEHGGHYQMEQKMEHEMETGNIETKTFYNFLNLPEP